MRIAVPFFFFALAAMLLRRRRRCPVLLLRCSFSSYEFWAVGKQRNGAFPPPAGSECVLACLVPSRHVENKYIN